MENKNVVLKVCVCVGGGGGAQTYQCPQSKKSPPPTSASYASAFLKNFLINISQDVILKIISWKKNIFES